VVFEATGSYDPLWLAGALLAVFAALLHVPGWRAHARAPAPA
jgi:hypothetical protein